MGYMRSLALCRILCYALLMKYTEKLAARISATHSALCVGLDPRPEGESLADMAFWLRRVVQETAPYAAAFKPNIAYFEAMGPDGLRLLMDLIPEIPRDIPVILDVKRGDIGETQKYYAKAYFEQMQVDAVTLNPFMGYDILAPFLNTPGKGLYLLAVTSNGGAADIERQRLSDGRKVYQLVGDMVERARREGAESEVGLVVGLTNADSRLFAELPDAPLLIPGLGAQGGELDALNGATRTAPSLINVSRGILYKNPEMSYANKAKMYAEQIRRALSL